MISVFTRIVKCHTVDSSLESQEHIMCQVSPHDKVRRWSTYLGIGRISLKTI